MGNNDDIVLDIIHPPKDLTQIHKYLNNRHSIIHDMGYVNGSDYYEFAKVAKKKYKKVIKYILNMYDIVQIDNKIFVHAGIEDEFNLKNNNKEMTLTKLFFSRDTEHTFKNMIICGHTPCCLYVDEYINNNPHYNKDKNILSIDGGNMIHDSGQLNMVIFDDIKTSNFKNYYYIFGIHKIAQNNQIEQVIGLHIKYYDNLIQLIEQKDTYFIGTHISSNKVVSIDNNKIIDINGSIVRVYELSLYELPVNIGDNLIIISKDYNGYYCNNKGIIGYYKGDFIE
jgi:protein phosphatase